MSYVAWYESNTHHLTKTTGFACRHALRFMQQKPTHSTRCLETGTMLLLLSSHLIWIGLSLMLEIAINLSHFLPILPSLPQCRTEWFEFLTTPSPKLLFVSDCVDETFISTLQTGVIFTQQLIQKTIKSSIFLFVLEWKKRENMTPELPLFVRMAVNSTPILHVYCSLVSVVLYPHTAERRDVMGFTSR